MTTIWKATLHVTDRQTVRLPRYARMLTAQMQDDVPRLWALVEPKEPLVDHTVLMFGTGNPIEGDFVAYSNGCYLGTIQADGFVWHVFTDGRIPSE